MSMTREEAIGVMRDLWCFWKSERYSDREIREACEIAIEALKQERPHGEWGEVFEHLGVKYHKCMACYTGIKVDATHHNFCPNCGADMRIKTDFN